MNDEAFVAAIAASPDDDTLRLVYADWLDERSDPRAEFVRAEVAANRLRSGGAGEKPPGVFERLARLRPGFARAWLAVVDRVESVACFWSPDPRSWVTPRPGAVAHILTDSGWCETPGGTDATEYRAACGAIGFDYGYGAPPDHTGTAVEALRAGAPLCPACLATLR